MTVVGKFAVGGTLFLCISYHLGCFASLNDFVLYAGSYIAASLTAWCLLAIGLPVLANTLGDTLIEIFKPIIYILAFCEFIGLLSFELPAVGRLIPFDIENWILEVAAVVPILLFTLPGAELVLIGITILLFLLSGVRGARVATPIAAGASSARTDRLQKIFKDNSRAYDKAITRKWEWNRSKLRLLELRPGGFHDPIGGDLKEFTLEHLKKASPPPFVALSWPWGDLVKTRAVYSQRGPIRHTYQRL